MDYLSNEYIVLNVHISLENRTLYYFRLLDIIGLAQVEFQMSFHVS